MVCCALAVSRGTWWTFSRKRCPASVSGRGALRKFRSRPPVWVMPNDLASTNCGGSPAERKIAMRSTSRVRDRRSTTELSIMSRSVSELSSRPNSIRVLR